jgi:3-methyladenine DNA glycosylase AlkD
MNFLNTLTNLYTSNRNEDFALQMHNYMKCKFNFFGIKATERRILLKTAIDEHKKEVARNYKQIAKDLFQLEEREFHMCAIEIIEKYSRKHYDQEDISLINYLIVNNSWWDTVDFIAKQILGKYLIQYPEKIKDVILKFSNSENLWLIRSTVLFQLGYKSKTNEELLYGLCIINSNSNEFFIKKAIGWSLREYGKTNPKSVLNFVNSTELKPLSKKEAIRNIIK